MSQVTKLRIKLFADGASVPEILELNRQSHIQGFTTNPTLMRKAGIKDYKQFASELLAQVKDKPISFEVFADDFKSMYRQAKEINSWGENVNVKIPVMNTQRQYSYELIKTLSDEGVKLNVTAVFTLEQVRKLREAMKNSPWGIVSVFAGRIADTGLDPIPLMSEALEILQDKSQLQLLWASPREFLNIVQADKIGCHIITATPDLIKKLSLLDKNLEDFSQETVEMFYRDAKSAGYEI